VEVGGGRVGFGGGKGRERSICAGFGLLAVGWGLGYLTSTSTVGVQGNFGQIGARFERASKIFAKERRENRRSLGWYHTLAGPPKYLVKSRKKIENASRGSRSHLLLGKLSS
jgi:hypothetical protein